MALSRQRSKLRLLLSFESKSSLSTLAVVLPEAAFQGPEGRDESELMNEAKMKKKTMNKPIRMPPHRVVSFCLELLEQSLWLSL